MQKNSSFQRFLIFQFFNNIGIGIFNIFMIWWIHFLFQNPIYTGLAGFVLVVSGIFNFMIGPFIDKSSKTRIMKIGSFVLAAVSGGMIMSSTASKPDCLALRSAVSLSSRLQQMVEAAIFIVTLLYII